MMPATAAFSLAPRRLRDSRFRNRAPWPAAPGGQRGAAVLVAMLVVALAALAASGFMFRAHVEWRHLENMMRLDQAHWVLRATERWGAAVLQDDARQSAVDQLGEAWATRLPPVEAEGFRVSGSLQDQDGRFNLNNLALEGEVDTRQYAILVRLLNSLQLPEMLAASLADWLDTDERPISQDSAEADYYASQRPCGMAGRPLLKLNELLCVKGFDRDRLALLRPFVTVLPTRTAVNVNTAPAEVLAALVEGLSLSEAYAMVAKRNRVYYRNGQDFQQALPAGLAAPEALVAVSSRYFLAQARIRQDRLDIGSQAMFRRDGSSPPVLVWRAEL